MSELDDRIRRSLHRQSERVSIEPEPEDLTDRFARRERTRTRALTAALLLALLAGPTLGFIAGRGGGDTTRDGVARPRTGDDDRDKVVIAPDGDVPKLAPDAALAGAGGAETAPRSTTESFSTGQVIVGPGYGGYYGAQRLAKFFNRDAGAVKIRAFRADIDAPITAGPPWWEPAEWCFPNGIVQADVSSDDMVGIATGSVYAQRRDSSVGGTLSVIGIAEGAPQWVLVAQSTSDAATLRARFPGGGTDEMAPVDGMAVLVAPAAVTAEFFSNRLPDERATIEALDAGGTAVATADIGLWVDGFGLGLEDGSGQESCYGPQQLPPPGEEQPADSAAARAEIEAGYGRPTSEVTMEERLAGLDDPRGMEDVWDELLNGSFAEQVRNARSVVRDIVFLSATRAAVQYDVEIPNYTSFPNRFAEHVFVDGRWKLTRESLCRDISLAGVVCPEVG